MPHKSSALPTTRDRHPGLVTIGFLVAAAWLPFFVLWTVLNVESVK